MQALLFVVCLALIFSFAQAQNVVCNTTFTEICLKNQQAGCNNVPPANTEYLCAVGTYCNSGTCTAIPTIGQACTTACWDPNYTGIVCNAGFCSWQNLYGPGEKCQTSTTAVPYVNGGCLTGLTCSSGVCSAQAAGADCTTIPYCNAGLYCVNGTCATRLASGSNCNANSDCVETTICTARGSTTASTTCQAPFASAAGGGCDSVLDCQANLYCSAGTCTAAPAEGQSCTNDASCPTSAVQSCECTEKSKSISNGTVITEEPPVCVNDITTYTSSQISGYNSFQSCSKSSPCFDTWSSANYGFQVSTGPNQCQFSCSGASDVGFVKNGLSFNSCNFGGAASALTPVAALLALVFLVAALL